MVEFEINPSVNVCTQLWSTETVDGYGEIQVETCCVDGLKAVKDRREAWTKGPYGRSILISQNHT